MVDETDKLYLRRKLSGDLDEWRIANLGKISPVEYQYDFDNYNFKINDVIYRDYSPKFEEAVGKLQFWATLHN